MPDKSKSKRKRNPKGQRNTGEEAESSVHESSHGRSKKRQKKGNPSTPVADASTSATSVKIDPYLERFNPIARKNACNNDLLRANVKAVVPVLKTENPKVKVLEFIALKQNRTYFTPPSELVAYLMAMTEKSPKLDLNHSAIEIYSRSFAGEEHTLKAIREPGGQKRILGVWPGQTDINSIESDKKNWLQDQKNAERLTTFRVPIDADRNKLNKVLEAIENPAERLAAYLQSLNPYWMTKQEILSIKLVSEQSHTLVYEKPIRQQEQEKKGAKETKSIEIKISDYDWEKYIAPYLLTKKSKKSAGLRPGDNLWGSKKDLIQQGRSYLESTWEMFRVITWKRSLTIGSVIKYAAIDILERHGISWASMAHLKLQDIGENGACSFLPHITDAEKSILAAFKSIVKFEQSLLNKESASTQEILFLSQTSHLREKLEEHREMCEENMRPVKSTPAQASTESVLKSKSIPSWEKIKAIAASVSYATEKLKGITPLKDVPVPLILMLQYLRLQVGLSTSEILAAEVRQDGQIYAGNYPLPIQDETLLKEIMALRTPPGNSQPLPGPLLGTMEQTNQSFEIKELKNQYNVLTLAFQVVAQQKGLEALKCFDNKSSFDTVKVLVVAALRDEGVPLSLCCQNNDSLKVPSDPEAEFQISYFEDIEVPEENNQSKGKKKASERVKKEYSIQPGTQALLKLFANMVRIRRGIETAKSASDIGPRTQTPAEAQKKNTKVRRGQQKLATAQGNNTQPWLFGFSRLREAEEKADEGDRIWDRVMGISANISKVRDPVFLRSAGSGEQGRAPFVHGDQKGEGGWLKCATFALNALLLDVYDLQKKHDIHGRQFITEPTFKSIAARVLAGISFEDIRDNAPLSSIERRKVKKAKLAYKVMKPGAETELVMAYLKYDAWLYPHLHPDQNKYPRREPDQISMPVTLPEADDWETWAAALDDASGTRHEMAFILGNQRIRELGEEASAEEDASQSHFVTFRRDIVTSQWYLIDSLKEKQIPMRPSDYFKDRANYFRKQQSQAPDGTVRPRDIVASAEIILPSADIRDPLVLQVMRMQEKTAPVLDTIEKMFNTRCSSWGLTQALGEAAFEKLSSEQKKVLTAKEWEKDQADLDRRTFNDLSCEGSTLLYAALGSERKLSVEDKADECIGAKAVATLLTKALGNEAVSPEPEKVNGQESGFVFNYNSIAPNYDRGLLELPGLSPRFVTILRAPVSRNWYVRGENGKSIYINRYIEDARKEKEQYIESVLSEGERKKYRDELDKLKGNLNFIAFSSTLNIIDAAPKLRDHTSARLPVALRPEMEPGDLTASLRKNEIRLAMLPTPDFPTLDNQVPSIYFDDTVLVQAFKQDRYLQAAFRHRFEYPELFKQQLIRLAQDISQQGFSTESNQQVQCKISPAGFDDTLPPPFQWGEDKIEETAKQLPAELQPAPIRGDLVRWFNARQIASPVVGPTQEQDDAMEFINFENESGSKGLKLDPSYNDAPIIQSLLEEEEFLPIYRKRYEQLESFKKYMEEVRIDMIEASPEITSKEFGDKELARFNELRARYRKAARAIAVVIEPEENVGTLLATSVQPAAMSEELSSYSSSSSPNSEWNDEEQLLAPLMSNVEGLESDDDEPMMHLGGSVVEPGKPRAEWPEIDQSIRDSFPKGGTTSTIIFQVGPTLVANNASMHMAQKLNRNTTAWYRIKSAEEQEEITPPRPVEVTPKMYVVGKADDETGFLEGLSPEALVDLLLPRLEKLDREGTFPQQLNLVGCWTAEKKLKEGQSMRSYAEIVTEALGKKGYGYPRLKVIGYRSAIEIERKGENKGRKIVRTETLAECVKTEKTEFQWINGGIVSSPITKDSRQIQRVSSIKSKL